MNGKVLKSPKSEQSSSDLICQSDINGVVKQAPRPKFSWLASLCNCFKAEDFNYSIQNDQSLLIPQKTTHSGRNTLVLDLDETLVHSSFTKVKSDFTIEIIVERQVYNIYVLKRPGVDEFLKKCAELFELVIFTASLPAYADPLLNLLDPNGLIGFRLFRSSCCSVSGGFVKDLSRLGRDLKHVAIIDNAPISYAFQPNNAIPIKTWIDDPDDRELEKLISVLEQISVVNDIPKVLEELKNNNLNLNVNNVQETVKNHGILTNRGPFNSPTHVNGDKKFMFE